MYALTLQIILYPLGGSCHQWLSWNVEKTARAKM